jgi:beta-glucanase (GH16 family)
MLKAPSRSLIVLLAAGLWAGSARGAGLAAAPRPEPWVLAWSDEFDGPAGAAPDAGKWGYDVGGDGWGNQEREFYCRPGANAAPCDAKRPNAHLDGHGRLVIEAFKSSGTWTSARLKTIGLEQFGYGRVEARLRLPTGAGLWPAFWLLGVDISSAGWPGCGEIDVMENIPAVGENPLGPTKIQSTLHGPGYSGAHGIGRAFTLPGGGRVDDGFHVYGALWSPGRLSFYVDDPGAPFFTATPRVLPAGQRWVFDHPFFIILNLAVGGSWPQDPDATTPDPARLLVDWVRVYKPR